MKTLRSEWPQVRQYEKKGHTYFAVDMRRAGYNGQKWRNCPDKVRALEYAREIAKKVAATGLNSINRLNQDPRIAAWQEQLAIYGKTIDDAFNLALKTYAQEARDRATPFFGELVNVWVDDKATDKLKPIRPRSLKTLRSYASLFKRHFGDIRIAEITQEKVETFLSSKGNGGQYKANLRNYLSQFFNWTIKKNYYDKNPCKDIEITVERETPKYFSVADCERLMSIATEKNMVGYFCLCLFGGVRPEETEKLTWQNINLETKEILIPKDTSKTKKPRQWIVSPTLYAWLSSLDTKQPLIPSNLRRSKRQVMAAMGNWHPDILRHSFCTYTYANDPHHNLANLAHVMGNSPKIIETFYKGVIPQAEVEKWFNILPA
jgi:integrase